MSTIFARISVRTFTIGDKKHVIIGLIGRGSTYRKGLNLDDFPLDLFSQVKEANGTMPSKGSGWRTRVKKEKASPFVVGRVMGMAINQTIQGWELGLYTFFQANGGAPTMDEANRKT